MHITKFAIPQLSVRETSKHEDYSVHVLWGRQQLFHIILDDVVSKFSSTR